MSLIRFYPYQKRWIGDDARFKAGMFSRQSGKTFSTSGELVKDCILAEITRRRTRWVILSRGERQAAEAMNEAIKPQIKAFYELYRGELAKVARQWEPHFSEVDFRGEEAVYKALEVTFPGGSRITALPANPDTARGFSANVMLDEFAFHKDSRAIWAAVFPVVSKDGLKLRVISTPNGKGNKFYDIMSGTDAIWSRHVVDIYQAVADGLPRDIDELRAGCGDEDTWRQEYELEWLDEASAWLTYELIGACEDERASSSGEGYLGGPCYVGVDIGRRKDLFVIWVWEQVGDVLWTREIIARQRIPFSEQDALLDDVMRRYNVVRVAMDQTGMGEKPVEDAQARHGSLRVEGVILSSSRRLDVATAAKQQFQDRKVRIPMGDPVLRSDLHQLKASIGPTGALRLAAERDANGHADRTWAGFLGIASSVGGSQPAAGETVDENAGSGDADELERVGAGRGLVMGQSFRRRLQMFGSH